MARQDCPECPECCSEECFEQLECVYSCDCCCHIEIVPAPSQALLAGTLMAQRTADNLWLPYNPLAVDGLQYPRGVLKFTTTVNADGDITNMGVTFLGAMGCGPKTTYMYICGSFMVADTIGNLAAALGNPGFGRMLEGSVDGPGVWKLL